MCSALSLAPCPLYGLLQHLAACLSLLCRPCMGTGLMECLPSDAVLLLHPGLCLGCLVTVLLQQQQQQQKGEISRRRLPANDKLSSCLELLHHAVCLGCLITLLLAMEAVARSMALLEPCAQCKIAVLLQQMADGHNKLFCKKIQISRASKTCREAATHHAQQDQMQGLGGKEIMDCKGKSHTVSHHVKH